MTTSVRETPRSERVPAGQVCNDSRVRGYDTHMGVRVTIHQ